jgi:hypothetical protein
VRPTCFLDIHAQQSGLGQGPPQPAVEALWLLLYRAELIDRGKVAENLLRQLLHATQFF